MTVKINQIYFKDEHEEHLDPAFHPYNNKENPFPHWAENYIIHNAYTNKLYLESDYSGYVSWKFQQKTTIDGETFINFIKDNPGYDVYFINPFPAEHYFYKNNWYHGESYHKGLFQFAESVFKNLNYNIDIENQIHKRDILLFCNYWVGNKTFWEEYMSFIQPIYNYIKADKLTSDERKLLNKVNHYKINKGINLLPFFFERLFSTFLYINKNIKYLSYNEFIYQQTHSFNKILLRDISNEKPSYFALERFLRVKIVENTIMNESIKNFIFKVARKLKLM